MDTEYTLREEIEDIILRYDTKLNILLERLNSVIKCNIHTTESVTDDLIDLEFLEELRKIQSNYENVTIYFGKTLRDIKFTVLDDEKRKHDLIVNYKDSKKYIITLVNLPHSSFQEREYDSLDDILLSFMKHLERLSSYFYELEQIDKVCTIMEPIEPSFKDSYRRILLDERTWLHVEVTPDGLATNIHLVGQSDLWSNKLQKGLLSWDHDSNIVNNILIMFDLEDFPVASTNKPSLLELEDKHAKEVKVKLCSICLCAEIPDNSSLPLPLCPKNTCGVYFHRNCLFQWLVTCSGGRPPAFGVASGSCPACLHPIACSEKDE